MIDDLKYSRDCSFQSFLYKNNTRCQPCNLLTLQIVMHPPFFFFKSPDHRTRQQDGNRVSNMAAGWVRHHVRHSLQLPAARESSNTPSQGLELFRRRWRAGERRSSTQTLLRQTRQVRRWTTAPRGVIIVHICLVPDSSDVGCRNCWVRKNGKAGFVLLLSKVEQFVHCYQYSIKQNTTAARSWMHPNLWTIHSLFSESQMHNSGSTDYKFYIF